MSWNTFSTVVCLFLFHHSSFSFAFFLLFFSLLSSFLSVSLFSLQLPISFHGCSHTSFLSLNFIFISYSVSFLASVSTAKEQCCLWVARLPLCLCSLPHTAAELSVICRESDLPWTGWVIFLVYQTLYTWSWQCWKNSCVIQLLFLTVASFVLTALL